MNKSQRPTPPLAPRRPVVRERHGERLEDDYAWLKDDNWQEVMREPDVLKPEIGAYLRAENDFHQGQARKHRAAARTALL